MIELNGFGKDYGEFTAVESLDLNQHYQQALDLVEGSAFAAESLESALDRNILIAQEAAAAAQGSVRVKAPNTLAESPRSRSNSPRRLRGAADSDLGTNLIEGTATPFHS